MLARTAPFVERDSELAALRELLKDAEAGRGSLVVIAGEAGIGKTRLADHFVAEFGRRSAMALWGRCHPDPDVPAYWPWKQIIARYAERRHDSELQRDLGSATRDIVPLIPELTLRFPEFAVSDVNEPPEARQRVFEGMVEFLKNAARRQPLLIVIDDLQWIDNASLSLLELMSAQCSDGRLLLIAACRAADFTDSRVEARVGTLSSRSHHLALNGLDATGVAKLIRVISGRTAPPRVIRAMHEATQGNPLFVDQLTRYVSAHDAWDNLDLGRLGLPRELKLAIESRLARLSDRTRSILANAAVVGKSTSVDILAKLVDLPIPDLLRELQEPVAARILQEAPGSPREYSFAHVLIRETIYDALSPHERMEIHSRVAQAIVDTYGPHLNEHLSAAAHHFFQVARSGSSESAIKYCTLAGDRAVEMRAFEEAVGYYRRALVAFDIENRERRERTTLLLKLGKTQRQAGDIDHAKKTFLEAIAVARDIQDSVLFAEAALGFAGPWNSPLFLPDTEVLELLEEAGNRLRGSEPALRARVIARRVHEHWWSLSRDAARAELDQALELAEASAEPNAIAHVLHIRHLALWDHEDVDGRLKSALRIVELRAWIETELVLEGYCWLMTDELERGNMAGFEAARFAYAELARRVHLPNHIASSQVRSAARDLLRGRLRDAEKTCDAEIKKGGDGTLWWTFLSYAIHRERGTLAEVEPLVRALTSMASMWPAMRYWLVGTLAEAGSADARLEFEGLATNEFRDAPTDLTRLTLLSFAAEACTIVGTLASARVLHEALAKFAGRQISFGNGLVYFDSISHLLARLAAQLEQWETADQHFSEALRQAQALGAGPRTAHIEFHWAVMLGRRGRADDVSRAHTLLSSAAAAAVHFELSGLISKIEALQRRLCGDGFATMPEPLSIARAVTAPPPAAHERDGSSYVFRCDGEFWSLQFGREMIRLKDSRGLHLIAALLRNPGAQVHSLELGVGSETHAFKKSSAGAMLDTKARDSYRKRLQELALEQAEAEAHNDPPRRARAQHESELLTQQLARALGLGGRNRRTAAEAERARINVTRSIRSAISRMKARSPGLAHHLDTSIRTGTFCHYVPDPSGKIDWKL